MSMIFNIVKSAQIFLIRRNIAGGMGDYVMTITTAGRVTDKKYTTPISYIYDGPHVVALTRKEALPDWYQNARKAAEAVLNIKGKGIAVYAEEVLDETECQRLFDIYKDNPELFKRLFKLAPDAPLVEQQAVLSSRTFMHFTRIVP